MKKDETKKADGIWFVPATPRWPVNVAKRGPVLEDREPGQRARAGQQERAAGSRPRRASRRKYAKQLKARLTTVPSFKSWLRAIA